jgi:hypothetical protein
MITGARDVHGVAITTISIPDPAKWFILPRFSL